MRSNRLALVLVFLLTPALTFAGGYKKKIKAVKSKIRKAAKVKPVARQAKHTRKSLDKTKKQVQKSVDDLEQDVKKLLARKRLLRRMRQRYRINHRRKIGLLRRKLYKNRRTIWVKKQKIQ